MTPRRNLSSEWSIPGSEGMEAPARSGCVLSLAGALHSTNILVEGFLFIDIAALRSSRASH